MILTNNDSPSIWVLQQNLRPRSTLLKYNSSRVETLNLTFTRRVFDSLCQMSMGQRDTLSSLRFEFWESNDMRWGALRGRDLVKERKALFYMPDNLSTSFAQEVPSWKIHHSFQDKINKMQIKVFEKDDTVKMLIRIQTS